MIWRDVLKQYLQEKNKLCAGRKSDKIADFLLNEELVKPICLPYERSVSQYKERNAKILRCSWRVRPVLSEQPGSGSVHVRLDIQEKKVYEINGQQNEEERVVTHEISLFEKNGRWYISKDEPLFCEDKSRAKLNLNQMDDIEEIFFRTPSSGGTYNRKMAKRYADLWWNRRNPRYRAFDVDCTNFVSQCLFEGGFLMEETGRRSDGWWYRFQGGALDQWSYSWAVAHSLRWYFSLRPLRVKEVPHAANLSIGDVICYDWNGDGHWQHNTIVTGKDGNGMPLVNAHSTDSRGRYWDYRDSYAWTKMTKYKFFHIIG
jgi:hypothetical protein